MSYGDGEPPPRPLEGWKRRAVVRAASIRRQRLYRAAPVTRGPLEDGENPYPGNAEDCPLDATRHYTSEAHVAHLVERGLRRLPVPEDIEVAIDAGFAMLDRVYSYTVCPWPYDDPRCVSHVAHGLVHVIDEFLRDYDHG